MKVASVKLNGESRLAVERNQQWVVLEPDSARPFRGISDWLEQATSVSAVELISLLEQGRNQAALLVIPTAHQDVCLRLWGCVGEGDPMPFRIQQASFPSCGTLTLRLSDGDLWFQADDQTGGQHLALHLGTAHRQSAEKLLFQRPGADLQQGLGKAQLGRLDDLVGLEGSATLKDHRLRATQGPAVAQQDPGESPTEKNHGDEAPELNQQGSAALPAQLASTGDLSGDGPFGR